MCRNNAKYVVYSLLSISKMAEIIVEAASSASSIDGAGCEIELLPLEKAKSGVWVYFGFTAKNGKYVVKDNLCVCVVYEY